ncbi:M16 family metallopeptidase [Sphingosinicella terrae]|uniref:M16 family metallopeptidase n=1 Tax=Sphingosinicella terrae TaxID=2172047 RepID=UPI000E0CD66D|nr:pitrilysin family protein [Sphingosinicella terrae]
MKRLTILLAATAMSFAASPAFAADDEALVPFEQFTLPNGLRVVVHEDHSVPKVAVSVWYHVGSMNEPEGRSGFAHLFEHLMFNGSEHHDAEYFPPLQEIGASAVNGATSNDLTFYYEVVPTGGLERVLFLESDRMGHLLGAVTQAKLDEQRGVVQNEKRTWENQPYALMPQMRMAGLFPQGHPYRHPVIGSMEDLDRASIEDVRAWFGQYYGAANAVVTLAGDVSVEQARQLVTRYFGSIPAGPPTSRVTRWVPELREERRETMIDDVPQAAVSRSWAVPGRGTAEAPALRMMARVLGWGRTSRLYQRLVHDLQIASEVSANYESYAVAGVFTVDAKLRDGVDPAAAEAAIDTALAEFLAEGPTEAELERAKMASYADMVRSMESIYVRAMALSDGALFAGDPGRFAADERRFAAVTAAEVRTAGAEWLRRGSYRLTVLPHGNHSVTPDTADRSRLPDMADSPGLTLPAIEEARLSNGLRVRFARRTGVPTVDLAMTFDAGSAADPAGRRGLAGFTVGLMDDGTSTLTGQQFAERQAALGARMHGYGDSDTTSFALSALARTLPESIALWADYIRNPGFRPEDLERERGLALASLTQSLADPASIAQRTFSHLVFGADHAYGTALAGRAETLRGYSREDAEIFHESWIRPDNAILYASGDVDLDTLVAALDRALGDWTPPARPQPPKNVAPLEPAPGRRVILVDRPGSIQSVIRVGHVMPSGLDPRDFEIGAMNEVLGGNFTSRLNMNLREDKGWTYGASSFVADARGPQMFGVATSVQTDRTADALVEIRREIDGLRGERPATAQELDLVRRGRILALPGQLETNSALVGYLQHIDRFERPYDYLAGLPERYEALRPETIGATAREMIRPEALVWVVVGDLSQVEAGIRALELGAVEVWDAEGRRLR